MEEIIPCSPEDREVFQRVWQRVMAGRAEGSSLIRPNPTDGGDVSCEVLRSMARQEGSPPPPCGPGEEQPPEEQPPEEQPPGEQPPEEQPPEEEVPTPKPPAQNCPCCCPCPPPQGGGCWGDLPPQWEGPQPDGDCTARLRRHVMDALEGWQFYRYLAGRTRGTDARTLNSMAAELHREARKLSAAYFLLTGLRYWPSELLGVPAIPSYWGALRQRHQAEQRQENAYRLAADDWDDPDLLALYGALIQGCQGRCRRLRSLLEQGM